MRVPPRARLHNWQRPVCIDEYILPEKAGWIRVKSLTSPTPTWFARSISAENWKKNKNKNKNKKHKRQKKNKLFMFTNYYFQSKWKFLKYSNLQTLQSYHLQIAAFFFEHLLNPWRTLGPPECLHLIEFFVYQRCSVLSYQYCIKCSILSCQHNIALDAIYVVFHILNFKNKS